MPIVSPIPQPGGSEVGQKKRYVRHQGSTDEIFCHPPVRFLFRSSRCSSTAGPNHHLAAVTTVGRVPGTDRRPLSRRRVLGTSSGFRTLAAERQKNQNLDERAHAFRTGFCLAGSSRARWQSPSTRPRSFSARRPEFSETFRCQCESASTASSLLPRTIRT